MRTTVGLPADLHAQVVAIARDTHRTLSETVALLVRRGLGEGRAAGQFLGNVTSQSGRWAAEGKANRREYSRWFAYLHEFDP